MKDWTREAIDGRYTRLRDYLMKAEKLDLDLYDDLVKLYVSATTDQIRHDDYYELAEVFRKRLEEAQRLRA